MPENNNSSLRRGNCFKLLAACFYEPEKELFVEEKLCQNLRDLLDGWASGAAKAASDMEFALANSDQEQLSVAHAELFVGPFELIAAPYGSVYLEKNRQIMGDSTIGVLKSYEEAGLSVDEKEPPDHIAIELEFMAYLCTKEAGARAGGNHSEADNYLTMQKDFYRLFLSWTPDLCDAIQAGSQNPFYRAVADCLARFMITCEQIYGLHSANTT
jgi:TorA maturation chaperone TorD